MNAFCSSQRLGSSCYSVVPPEVGVRVPSGLSRCSCSEATLFPGSAGSCLARGNASPGPSPPVRSRRALPWRGPRTSPSPSAAQSSEERLGCTSSWVCGVRAVQVQRDPHHKPQSPVSVCPVRCAVFRFPVGFWLQLVLL